MIFEKVKGINQEAFINPQYIDRFKDHEKRLNFELDKKEKKLLDDNKNYSINHNKGSIKQGTKDLDRKITDGKYGFKELYQDLNK